MDGAYYLNGKLQRTTLTNEYDFTWKRISGVVTPD